VLPLPYFSSYNAWKNRFTFQVLSSLQRAILIVFKQYKNHSRASLMVFMMSEKDDLFFCDNCEEVSDLRGGNEELLSCSECNLWFCRRCIVICQVCRSPVCKYHFLCIRESLSGHFIGNWACIECTDLVKIKRVEHGPFYFTTID